MAGIVGADIPPYAAGLGGIGGPFPGFVPGLQNSFNIDASASGGLLGGPLPGVGVGVPGFAGWGGPYVPVTPLGALGGIKGDLLVPIVIVGVALFLLLLIVLAVKAAITWKVGLLGELAGAKLSHIKREAGSGAQPLGESDLNDLADVVISAIYSDCWNKRMMCAIGSYAREREEFPSFLRVLQIVVPDRFHNSLVEVQKSAEGDYDCAQKYDCTATKSSSDQDGNQQQSQSQESKTNN